MIHSLKRNTMKINKLFSKKRGMILAGIALISISLTSCLKDNSPGSVDFSKSPALVAFQFQAAAPKPYVESIHNVNTVTTNVEIALSVSTITQSTPVTGTLVPDDAGAAAFIAADTADGKVDHIMPTSLYTVANGGKFTIAAGQQIIKIPITLPGDKIDFSQNYIIGLKIADVSGAQLTDNLNSAILVVTLQSVFEGTYNVTGSFVDSTAPGSGISDDGVYPETGIQLRTESALVVDAYDPTFGYYHQINSGGNTNAFFGNFDPIFHFNLAGDITSVSNYYGSGNSQGRDAVLDPSGVNASTGTPQTPGYSFKVSYNMTQGARIVKFVETWTYQGPL